MFWLPVIWVLLLKRKSITLELRYIEINASSSSSNVQSPKTKAMTQPSRAAMSRNAKARKFKRALYNKQNPSIWNVKFLQGLLSDKTITSEEKIIFNFGIWLTSHENQELSRSIKSIKQIRYMYVAWKGVLLGLSKGNMSCTWLHNTPLDTSEVKIANF